MYLFFMICGFFFVIGSSIVINYLFEIFPINKVTSFLNPTKETIFNSISITIIPNTIWALIEIVLLGNNYYFIVGFLLNIFITLCITYVIKYGYSLITSKESSIIDVVAIVFSVFFGFVCNYLCLLIGIERSINPLYSVTGILVWIGFYIIIRIFPPKSEFFRGNSIEK